MAISFRHISVSDARNFSLDRIFAVVLDDRIVDYFIWSFELQQIVFWQNIGIATLPKSYRSIYDMVATQKLVSKRNIIFFFSIAVIAAILRTFSGTLYVHTQQQQINIQTQLHVVCAS